jgi:murein L,D-transpeptidase YafK
VIKTYKVALGGDPIGAKAQQGDHKTPEAIYVLDSRNPHSQFYKSIHISYPNASDRGGASERRFGGWGRVCPRPAQWLRLGRSVAPADWTDGSVAVTNQEIDEIWRAVPGGTPIEIRP